MKDEAMFTHHVSLALKERLYYLGISLLDLQLCEPAEQPSVLLASGRMWVLRGSVLAFEKPYRFRTEFCMELGQTSRDDVEGLVNGMVQDILVEVAG